MKSNPTPSGQSKAWMRMIGLGMELAATTLIFLGLGYWLDHHRQHDTPYAAAAGALIGFTAGMIRFVMQAQRSQQ